MLEFRAQSAWIPFKKQRRAPEPFIVFFPSWILEIALAHLTGFIASRSQEPVTEI